MPLPQFMGLVAAVILAAGVTIWLASAAGVPLAGVGMVALLGAAIAHGLRKCAAEGAGKAQRIKP